MKLNITAESRKIWEETLALIEGQARRLFMASVVKDLGRGGAAWAHRELGWDRTTYKKVHPNVRFYGEAYPSGVKLDKKAMKPYEKCLERLDGLPKWFIKISSKVAAAMLASLAI